MSADMNIDHGERSRGSCPLPITGTVGGAGWGAATVVGAGAVVASAGGATSVRGVVVDGGDTADGGALAAGGGDAAGAGALSTGGDVVVCAQSKVGCAESVADISARRSSPRRQAWRDTSLRAKAQLSRIAVLMIPDGRSVPSPAPLFACVCAARNYL
jgi:hypothetical protein